MAGVRDYLAATRPWSFPMSLIAVASGALYAWWLGGSIEAYPVLLALVGVVLLHAAANLYNDYFDALSGVDRPGSGTVTYRLHPIVHGLMTPKGLLGASTALAVSGLALGALIASAVGPLPILLGLAGAVLAVEYTGPPLRLKYTGLGEAAVLAAWSLMFAGGAAAATGRAGLGVLAASIPFTLLVVDVLLANNIRDITTDSEAGVKTLAVRLGWARSVRLHKALIALAYILLVLEASAGLLPWASLAALASAPVAAGVYAMFDGGKAPPDADPRAARLALAFGLLLLAGIAGAVILQHL